MSAAAVRSLDGRHTREALTKLILSTNEAERARAQITTEREIEEFCSSDPDLSKQIAEKDLDSAQVARELFRNEWLKATLELAVEGLSPVTEEEMRRFYDGHPEKWIEKERRRVAHILITVQDQFAGNSETEARARIGKLRVRISRGESLAALAMEASECPTALEGGELGWVETGTLYDSLDQVAFSLPEGEVSLPIRTELGFHLIECREIRPESYLPFEAVADKLAAALEKRRKVAEQRRWVQRVASRGFDAS